MQAAVLSVKLPHLPTWSENRREHAAYYTEKLGATVGEYIVTPVEAEGNYHVYHQYTLRVQRRDKLQAFLNELGIATMIYYPIPLHLQPVFNQLGYKKGDLPETEKAANEALSLPMFPELKQEQQDYVIEKIIEFYS